VDKSGPIDREVGCVRVLITGAAGLIGRPTARLLAEEGHEVLATDLRPAPATDRRLGPAIDRLPQPVDPRALTGEHPRIRWLRLDVRQRARVMAAFAELRPDAVVHLAARHFIPWCDRFPAATLRTNVIGTQNVADAVRELGGTRLVFASSAAVYGPSAERLGEDHPLDPDDIYGTSKATCERLLELAVRRDPEASVVVLRLFNAVGPGDPHPHLVPRLISELGHDGRRVRAGNLSSVRDYIAVEDVARAVRAAVRSERSGLTVANVGTGVGRSVAEVVQALGALVGRPLEVVSIPARRRAVDRPFLVADPTRARELLGWEPRVAFEAGLARTLLAEGVKLAEGFTPVGEGPAEPDTPVAEGRPARAEAGKILAAV
jgi:UDP-glucose 4-epimerase